jgi:hypothetical protein
MKMMFLNVKMDRPATWEPMQMVGDAVVVIKVLQNALEINP